MQDLALDKYILDIEKKYPDLMNEKEVCEILNFNKSYLCRLRKVKSPIPFIRIGNRMAYFKHDIIEFIKKNRKQ